MVSNPIKLAQDPQRELEQLSLQLEQAVDYTPGSVQIDLSEVVMVDSMLLSQFLKLHMRLRRRGLQIELVNVPSHCHKSFVFARLDQFFPVHEAEPEAPPPVTGAGPAPRHVES
jgi:anti-anti-sigma regulatory factor